MGQRNDRQLIPGARQLIGLEEHGTGIQTPSQQLPAATGPADRIEPAKEYRVTQDHTLVTVWLRTDDFYRAAIAVARWAGEDDELDTRIDEFEIDNEEMGVYLYRVDNISEPSLLMECVLSPDIEASETRVRELATALRQAEIRAVVDWVLVDGSGTQVGEEQSLRVEAR